MDPAAIDPLETLISLLHVFERHGEAVIAFFTIVLAFSTILLWWATRNLYKAGERQIAVARDTAKAAEDTAQAAKDAAEHNRLVERAWVKLSHVSPGLIPDPERKGMFSVQMQVKNTGRTPAHVHDMQVKPVLLSKYRKLPYPPNYERKGAKPRQAFLVANMAVYFGDNFSVTRTQLQQVNDGALKLYLIGYVDYMDAFGQKHRGGYARIYDPQPGLSNNLGFVTEDGYNYDRSKGPRLKMRW